MYWYKYEPLVWRVLDEASGLAVTENAIDAQPYHNALYRRIVKVQFVDNEVIDEDGNVITHDVMGFHDETDEDGIVSHYMNAKRNHSIHFSI